MSGEFELGVFFFDIKKLREYCGKVRLYLINTCLIFGGRFSRGEGAEEDVASPRKFFLKERRRSVRIRAGVPASLVLRHGQQGEIVAGASTPGGILDLSLCGAGLSIDQIRVGSHHLFYSPQDNPAYVLHLQVEPPPEDETGLATISIPVRPIRFDRVLGEENDPKPFYVGVEFLLEPDDEQVQLLFRLLDEKNKGKGWWQSVIDSIRTATRKG